MSITREKREKSLGRLLKETRNRCMACGKPVGNGEGCSISKIVPRSPGRGWVALERRTVLCRECELRKNTFTIPDLVNSFRTRARLDYLFRVTGARLRGGISVVKMRALLYGFSLLQGGPPTRRAGENKRESLLNETDHRCVYCGCVLDKDTMTIDHIVALSRGGTSEDDNCVASCSECNYRKGCATISAFMDTFSDSGKKKYLERVRRLERKNQISREKAQRLLGRRKVPYLDWSIRLFGLEIDVRVSRLSSD